MRKCVFVNAFEILIKNIIIPYFITPTQYSNDSIELCNLMCCSRSIEKYSDKILNHNSCIILTNAIELNGLGL